MKKIVSLVFVLMLCGICFCREICSTYFGNLDTDDMAKYHVGVLAISTCQDIVKDKEKFIEEQFEAAKKKVDAREENGKEF